MTDRKKLMKLLYKAQSTSAEAACYDDITYAQQIEMEADFLIANGVTFQKWIPVSERLPEVGAGTVLVARIYNGKPYVDIGEFICGTACCWGDEYAINPREHITTHWMPLPNPPKEVDK